ncbi:MAG: monovalent cation/H(+) antiporter subunit G [Pleurocapsa minor GSE-CHR-MK-17-07R]|jgi:multicomponent Na+:H+ antiporter subunit G|nr:monovalent cation/H(+) antiporter subunit G [Pleurocapsa minor GSE-CHR-MK 17-07R]
MLQLIGVFFLVFGVFFCVMGVIGNIRLPDIFTRLHATSKVSSMGILGLMVASALLVPDSASKAIALGVLVLFSAPVASQAIARSAYRDGCAMVGLAQDDLAVQYIDFSYNYTIGEEVPWQASPDEPEIDPDDPANVDEQLFGAPDEEPRDG